MFNGRLCLHRRTFFISYILMLIHSSLYNIYSEGSSLLELTLFVANYCVFYRIFSCYDVDQKRSLSLERHQWRCTITAVKRMLYYRLSIVPLGATNHGRGTGLPQVEVKKVKSWTSFKIGPCAS